MTDIEVDVFNNNRDWFNENNIRLCISNKQTINICRNKKNIEEFKVNKQINILTIPTFKLNDVKITDFQFPIVCKPVDGRSSQGLNYIRDANDWNAFIEKPI